jgi:hypothetical protein
MNAAVLTGDIVNSTKLKAKTERKLLKVMGKLMEPYKYEFYRGDSFQVYVKDPEKSLRLALLCRTAAISISQTDDPTNSDIRISIGIGETTYPVRTLGAAKGEAFLLSGRAFDELEKTGERLSFSTTNPLANLALAVIADHINSIYKEMTGKQAEVIFELLKGQSQQEVAEILKKSKSTIHQHVISGRWNEIEKLLTQFENILKQIA